MANPSSTLICVEEILKSVVVSLIDDQKGLQRLSECMKNSMVKRYFTTESLKRAEFRGAIETALIHEGVHDLIEHGSIGGAIERAWTGLQAAMHEGDHALLTTAVQAESHILQAYREALDNELPLPVRQLLSTQAAYIETSLDCETAMLASSR